MKKYGFTLIELLAVIVILAVIALIATPLIMKTINDAKEGSAKNSASGYVKALEHTLGSQMVKDSTLKPDERQSIVGKVTGKIQKGIETGDLTESSVSYDVQYKGTKPTGIDFILKHGTVTQGSKITISGYTFIMDHKGEWVKDGTSVIPPTTDAKAFATDSWDTIAQAVKSGNHPYKVGDTKEVTVKTLGTFTVRIANISTPEVCSTSGHSLSACGFVVEFEDVIATKRMNPVIAGYIYGHNIGGYPASEMKKYMVEEIFELLPTDLQKNIQVTKVVSSRGSEDENNFTSNEKLYLLSPTEIYGASFTNPYDTAKDTTHQLDYYKIKGVTEDNYGGAVKKNASGNADSWWTRSANSYSGYSFHYIDSDGKATSLHAYKIFGVSPAFRIG